MWIRFTSVFDMSFVPLPFMSSYVIKHHRTWGEHSARMATSQSRNEISRYPLEWQAFFLKTIRERPIETEKLMVPSWPSRIEAIRIKLTLNGLARNSPRWASSGWSWDITQPADGAKRLPGWCWLLLMLVTIANPCERIQQPTSIASMGLRWGFSPAVMEDHVSSRWTLHEI